MEDRYHDLIEDVTQQIADKLFEDADWLEEEHPLEIDGLMFQLVTQIGLAAVEKLWNRLADRKVDECRDLGMRISAHGEPVEITNKLGTAQVK